MTVSLANAPNVFKEISAENQYTDWLTVKKGERYTVAIGTKPGSGTVVTASIPASITVTLQRRLPSNDGNFIWDVETFTSATAVTGLQQDSIAGENMDIRIGVKTGDWSGSTNLYVRLGK